MRAALILAALLWSGTVWAQEPNLPLAPPQTAQGRALGENLQAEGLTTDLTYAASADNIARPEPVPQEQPRAEGISAWWVLGLVGLALAVWLRFGGSGILTRAAPQEGASVKAPDHWQVEPDLPAARLLDQIAAMPDRSAALVRLLRHCLLTAAQESQTRLTRADTERQAFARLPGDRPALRLILLAAELAHYGGRPVSDADFAQALQAGEVLLGGRHA